MKLALRKQQQKIRRAVRVRAKMFGTATVPRLSVSRSAKYASAQLIDDASSKTLVSASDKTLTTGKPIEKAREVGRVIGAAAKKIGIERVVFDRGSFRYHGRVAAVAEGAREAGLTL